MATAIIEIPSVPSGLTLTCDLFPRGSDVAADSGLNLVERTLCKTHYRTSTTAGLTGWHAAVVKIGSTPIGSWWVDMTDTASVHYATDTSPDVISTSGTGARTVVVTVNDGTDPLEGAIVRFTQGIETYTALTNASGVATFLLDDYTWTVSITKTGYTFTSTTLVVDGNKTPTYSMTAIAVAAPAAPNLSTGILLCLGVDGLIEEGVTIYWKLKSGPSGEEGIGYDTAEASDVSDANGIVQSANFVRLATYRARRGTCGAWVTFTVPDAASFDLPQVLGSP